jgi:hypothetical protein
MAQNDLQATLREGVLVAEDYETDFARLADPEDSRVPLYVESRYRFG